jgi:hypothetical protein
MLGAAAMLGSALVAGAAVQGAAPDRAFLHSQLGFSRSEIDRALRGTPVGRTLASPDSHETAVAGLVRVRIPPSFFLERYRDIASFKRGEMVQQVGRFSDPPRLDDLAPLTLTDADVAALKSCKAARCGVKLSAAAMARFQSEVNWSATDAQEQAAAVARRLLFERLQKYMAGGLAAVDEYADKSRPVRTADEFRGLLDHTPYLTSYAPELRQYLLEYPRGHLDRAESFFYWSKEGFGLKPLVSLTHVVIYHRPGGDIVIASKGLYASHYMEASLGLTVLGDASEEAEVPSVDLLYVNRSCVDALRGTFAALARGSVARRQRDAMEKEMRRLKARLETDFTAAVPKPERRP